MKLKKPLLAIGLAFGAGLPQAHSRILNQRELLSRCYAQLTGLRLGSRDPLYNELKTKPATQVCVDLLNAVKFGGDGVLTNASSLLHRAVLKQFHDFHRSWFEKRMLAANELNDSLSGTIDVYDPAQPSFYVTRSLFADGVPYSSVLKGTDNLEAVRDSAKATAAGSPTGFKRATRIYDGAYDGQSHPIAGSRMNESVVAFAATPDFNALQFAPVPLAQVGELIGIRVQPGQRNIGALWTKATGTGGAINDSGLSVPHNLHENFGAGAMGSQGFLILNFGHSFDYDTNGTTKLPRRWVSATFKSFLCREGPYVRTSDIAQFKRSEAEAPPFRQSESCIRCHAALDHAALTARNLVLAETSTFIGSYNRLTATIGRFNVSVSNESGQEFWPWKPVGNFKYQAPEGKLYFRSINGNLINQNVANLNELGSALAESEDFHACAAKRYVERLTGISVSLFDPYDSDNAALAEGMSAHDKELKQWVLALGQELKKSGSLKTLIKRIMESDYYKRSDFGK